MCRSAFRRTQKRNVTGRSHEAGGIPSQYLPDTTAHNRAGTGMSAGPFFTHGAAGLRPSVSSNPALSGFHSVQEKSEARWMYERLLAFCIRFFLNKNKKFLLELCRTGIKDAMPHIPDSVVSVSAF